MVDPISAVLSPIIDTIEKDDYFPYEIHIGNITHGGQTYYVTLNFISIDEDGDERTVYTTVWPIERDASFSATASRIYKKVSKAGVSGISRRTLQQHLRVDAETIDVALNELDNVVELYKRGREVRLRLCK